MTCTFSAIAFDRYTGFISFVFQKFSQMSEKHRKKGPSISPPRAMKRNKGGGGGGSGEKKGNRMKHKHNNNETTENDALPPATDFPSLQHRETEQRFSRPSSEFIGMSL